MTEPPVAAADRRSWLNRGVAGVGAASFFSDSGHELTTSLLPSLITTLGAGPGALGIIDGVSDALTGLSKLTGGPLAADPERRGRLASGGGYLGTAVATAAIGAATAVWQIALLRAFAWISRGLRGPARDMTLTSLVEREQYGRAAGAASYLAGYGLLAAVHASSVLLSAGFLLAGLGIGLGETAQTASVALALPTELRSQGFGLLGLVQAAGDLGATVVAGVLWAAVGAAVAFGYAAGWMLLAVLALALLGRAIPGSPPQGEPTMPGRQNKDGRP